MANILVTGGAGYVGGVCCSELIARQHEVTIVDDLSTGHADMVPSGIPLHVIDIGDRLSLREVLATNHFDVIFHFAAKALIPQSVTDPGVFFHSNINAGIVLLEEARKAGIRNFVFSSSAAVYGNPTSTPINEDHPKDPLNSYGETKLMFERILHWYTKAYGWSVVAFRYFNACGGTASVAENHKPETHIVPLLLEVAANERANFEIYGRDYLTPDGTCMRDYVHVLDIADAHIRALKIMGRSGLSIYNIGTGESFSVRQICNIVEKVVGVRLQIIEGSPRLGDPAVLCADPSRIMRELGWSPERSHIEHIVKSAWESKQRLNKVKAVQLAAQHIS